MCFLPNNWVLRSDQSAFFLYSLFDIPERSDHIHRSHAPFRAKFKADQTWCSQPLSFASSTKYILQSRDRKSIRGVIFSHSEPTNPSSITLHSDSSLLKSIIPGYWDSVVSSDGGSFVLHHSWSDPSTRSMIEPTVLDEKGTVGFVDWESGRMLLIRDCNYTSVSFAK